jgi:hypothetical protein
VLDQTGQTVGVLVTGTGGTDEAIDTPDIIAWLATLRIGALP